MRETVAVLAGAGIALIVIALPLGWALERWVFAPLVARVVGRYGALTLVPSLSDLSLVSAAGFAVVAAAAVIAGRRYATVTRLDALRTE